MNTVWAIALGFGAAILLVWLGLVVVLLVTGRGYGRPSLREIVRLLPDVLRLFKRLATDAGLPHGIRVRLWLLLAYLALPIDLIPDFIPVVGYADDAIIAALVLRSVVRGAGLDAVKRHWPGSPTGLAAVLRATNIADPSRDA